VSRFAVDSELVLAANGVIQHSIEKIQGDVNALHSQLSSLQDTWQGSAANSFQELVTRWRSTANLVDQQLAELGKALAYAASQYQEIEAANQRLFLA
jgi:WXG100 family type VII secretion target